MAIYIELSNIKYKEGFDPLAFEISAQISHSIQK